MWCFDVNHNHANLQLGSIQTVEIQHRTHNEQDDGRPWGPARILARPHVVVPRARRCWSWNDRRWRTHSILSLRHGNRHTNQNNHVAQPHPRRNKKSFPFYNLTTFSKRSPESTTDYEKTTRKTTINDNPMHRTTITQLQSSAYNNEGSGRN